MICYYHKTDLDGKCSAAIVRRKYPDCELIGVDYPDRPDFEKTAPGDTVFVVDFSFGHIDMDNLAYMKGVKLIWIDHHKTALLNAKAHHYDDAEGKREIGKAGCELTWEYLFPDEPMPEAVRLLGRYDVWDHSDENVLPFQYGMRLKEWDPSDSSWDPLLMHYDYVEMFIKDGELIIAYEKQRNTQYSQSMAFPVIFEGHKAWAINKALSNSKIFETMPQAQGIPLWILFSYKAGIWRYSLYSSPSIGLDVAKIAANYGGGGHAGAAGFQSDKYLLKE